MGQNTEMGSQWLRISATLFSPSVVVITMSYGGYKEKFQIQGLGDTANLSDR